MLADFNLTLLNLTQNFLPKTHSHIQTAHQIYIAIGFFYGAPCTQRFYHVKCSKSFLLGRICGKQQLTFLVLIFDHLLY